MYGTLLFVSNKKYKKDKVLQILQQYCYNADVPETLFGHLESDIVKEWFNAAKPPKFIELMNEKKIEKLQTKCARDLFFNKLSTSFSNAGTVLHRQHNTKLHDAIVAYCLNRTVMQLHNLFGNGKSKACPSGGGLS